jgi:hypothetical protein
MRSIQTSPASATASATIPASTRDCTWRGPSEIVSVQLTHGPANGRAFYEAVMSDPRQTPKDMEFESLLYVARAAIKHQTGREDAEPEEPNVSYETFSNREGWQ